MDYLVKYYNHFRYRNTALLVISLLVLIAIIDTPPVNGFLMFLETFGYVGAFIAGILFVSTFTVAPAGVILFRLAHILDPVTIALIAGLGAVVGDYLIFHFFKDRVFEEIKPVFMKLGGNNLSRLFTTPYFSWLAPVVGSIIIASPLPDEIGIGLMGISKLTRWQFIGLSFVLNFVGMFVIIFVSQIF